MTTVQGKKNSEPEPTSGVTEKLQEEAPKEAPAKPKLTKAEKAALFEAYETAHQKVSAAEKVLDDAKTAQGGAVKAIFEALGKGPFSWKGRELTVAKSAKGDGYHFRGESTREVEKIG